MRLPFRYLLFLIVGPALWLAVCGPGHAASERRDLWFINAGTLPIYAIRIGHRATGEWSGDVLGTTQVVGVGEEQHVRVAIRDTCWYDVRIQYSDGSVRERDDVDLCTARNLLLEN